MNSEIHNIISIRKLNFAYNHHEVLNEIDLEVPEGSIYGFLGPNGAGKSTTIKAVLGLLRIRQGAVYLFGKELNGNKTNLLSRVGAMVETPSLYDHLSARKNLEITRRLRSLPASRIDEVLGLMNLTADANRLVRQYSTGMRQRLSLAIALLGDPQLLILDEPINGLDPSGIIEIRNLLLNLNKEKSCTIFLSSHILDEIEKLCTHLAVIDKGKVLYQGEMLGLLRRFRGMDTLLLGTSDNQKSMQILNIQGSRVSDTNLSVPVSSAADTARNIKTLVDAGISVYSAVTNGSDLESSFLDILKEGGRS